MGYVIVTQNIDLTYLRKIMLSDYSPNTLVEMDPLTYLKIFSKLIFYPEHKGIFQQISSRYSLFNWFVK